MDERSERAIAKTLLNCGRIGNSPVVIRDHDEGATARVVGTPSACGLALARQRSETPRKWVERCHERELSLRISVADFTGRIGGARGLLMPVRYAKDDSVRRVTLTVEGPITIEEMTATADRLIEDRAWSFAIVFDARGRTGPGVTAAMVRTFVNHNERMASLWGIPGPLAVVPQNDAGFGMARMFELISRMGLPRPIRVCRSVEDAHDWLNAVRGEAI